MRIRTTKNFSLEGAAEAFMETLPSSSQPLLIPDVNAEDKARASKDPRINCFKVVYWTNP